MFLGAGGRLLHPVDHLSLSQSSLSRHPARGFICDPLSLLPPCLRLKVTASQCPAPGWVAGTHVTAQGPALCSTGAPWEASHGEGSLVPHTQAAGLKKPLACTPGAAHCFWLAAKSCLILLRHGLWMSWVLGLCMSKTKPPAAHACCGLETYVQGERSHWTLGWKLLHRGWPQ